MTKQETHERVLTAARLFCHGQSGQRLTKGQIAKLLGTSSAQITRWINSAETNKIIQYRFNPPRLPKLELELRQANPFLQSAIVLASVRNFDVARLVRGRVIAEYFDENVSDGMTVALAGGSTLYEMALALPERVRNISVAPAAIIGRGPTIDHIDPSVLVSIVWAKSGGRPIPLSRSGQKNPSAVGYATSIDSIDRPLSAHPAKAAEAVRKLNQKLQRLSSVKSVLDVSRQADVLFTSCGPLSVDPEHQQDFHNTTFDLFEKHGISKEWLTKQGVVGDICYTPIDKDGNGRPEWQFFPCVNSDDLRRLAASPGKIVVLTAGAYMSQGVRAALAGKLCNVLIVDEELATKLLV